MAAHADVVPEVKEFVEGEGVFADVILSNVYLKALAALLELCEAGLTLDANGHNASCDADVDRCRSGFELFGGKAVVGGAEFGNSVGSRVAVGVRGFGVGKAVELTQGGDLLELIAPLLVKIFFEL
jgi:hypothetical protein